MIEWVFLLQGMVEFALPMGVAVYLWKKFSVSGVVFVFGAIMAGLSLVRIPLEILVQKSLNQALDKVFVVFSLAVVAGIFEEGFRFLGYKHLFRPDKWNWENGLMYGAGFGGIGLIVFISSRHLLTFLFLQFAREVLPADYLAEILATPVYMLLAGTVEQSSLFCISIGLSIVVLQCFVQNSKKYLGAAVMFHTAVQAVILAAEESILIREVVLAAFAFFSLYIIMKLRRKVE